MSENTKVSFGPVLFIAIFVGVTYAFSGLLDALGNAKDIQSPDVIIDDKASERLRQQMTSLFPPESISGTLRKSRILLLSEISSAPFLFDKSGGMVNCDDKSSGSYVVTLPSYMPSVEVGFDADGNATARVPKMQSLPSLNDSFPMLQRAFKTLSLSCEMQAALAAEFGSETYPLYSGLDDVLFSSEEFTHVYFRASFDLSGKITKISSFYGTLEGRNATVSARLAHDLMRKGMRLQ